MMTNGVIAIVVVLYLAAGWYVADLVDTEDILLNTLVMLFWPLAVMLAIFTFIFWG